MRSKQNKIFKNNSIKQNKKTYSLKKYSNPFFRKKKKNKFKSQSYSLISLKIKFFLWSILLVLFASIWFFLYSSIFNIKDIKVSGQGRLLPSDISKIAWNQINNSWLKIWPQKNIFLFNENKFKKNIKNKYAFDSINIKKKLPNTLIVNYKEKEYALIWQTKNEYYYADKNGYIISKVDASSIIGKNYPIIKDKIEMSIKDKQLPINKNKINYILDLFNKFRKKNEFKIKFFFIDSDLNTVKVKITNGPEIYFNTKTNANKQLKKLEIIKSEKIKKDFNKKNYIDLRFGDRVYYQ